VSAACCGAEASGFDTSRALFETVVSFLDGAEAAALSHAELMGLHRRPVGQAGVRAAGR
jgi:hypothetical protein